MNDAAAQTTPLGPILGDGSEEISFGKYRLIRKIAVGGMAEVYLAKSFGQFGFEKPVVIKVLLPKLSADAEFVEMFVREALMAADFRHPGICQVYDVGETSGLYYICMEFVDGVDLTRIVRQARKSHTAIPLRISLKIARDLTAGLQYVHTARSADGTPLNIVHRDVTPQNIMVDFDGHVKLVDFGVAQTSLAEELKRSALKGKGPYMAPEQWRGDHVDSRADIFALGIVLYEMTVGKRLFKRGSPARVREAVLSGEIPPPLVVRPEYPPALEDLVLKALAFDPANRYPTAAELGEDLTELMVQEGLDASTEEMAAFMSGLFSGVSRDEVFRPLDLTAPGHAATAAATAAEAAANRECTPLPTDTLPSEPTEILPSSRKRLWIALGATALLLVGYAAGALIHGSALRGATTQAPANGAPAYSAAAPLALAPNPKPPPPQLEGCRATFGSVTVDADGKVTAVDSRWVRVLCPNSPESSQDDSLRAAAIAALYGWRFRPARFDDQPVKTTTPVTITFPR